MFSAREHLLFFGLVTTVPSFVGGVALAVLYPPGSGTATDFTLWSLGPGQEVLHDRQQAGGGYGSQILWSRGNIYVLGDDSNWWQWNAGVWVLIGPDDPGGGQ